MRTRRILLATMVGILAIVFGGCSGDGSSEEPTPKATVVVDGSPDSINCPWQLTGPNGYSHDGQGDETLSDRTPGEYTLTWGAVADWDLPDPNSQTQTVADGGSVTFTGTYTPQAGAVAVDAEPDSIDAPWQLTGPADYSYDGTGDETVSGLDPGDYALTWGAVSGYDGPSPGSETKAVSIGAVTTFDGAYILEVGTVALDLSNVDPELSGYVRVADDPSLEPQAFTIEAWITPQGPGYGGADRAGNVVIGKLIEGVAGVGLGSWALNWSAVSESLRFSVIHEAYSHSFVTVEPPEGTVPLDSTVHVAATFDGANLFLYIDGTVEATAAYPYEGVYYGDEDLLIGAGNFSSGYWRRFDGIIDDLRLWDHARSVDEITASMSCRLMGDEPGLLAYWSFETELTDDSGNGHDGVAEELGDSVNFVAPQVSLPGCAP